MYLEKRSIVIKSSNIAPIKINFGKKCLKAHSQHESKGHLYHSLDRSKPLISYTELCSVPVIGFISRKEISNGVPVIGFISRKEISNETVGRVRYFSFRDMNPITGTEHSSV